MEKKHQLYEQENARAVLSEIRFAVNKRSMRQRRKFYAKRHIFQNYMHLFYMWVDLNIHSIQMGR